MSDESRQQLNRTSERTFCNSISQLTPDLYFVLSLELSGARKFNRTHKGKKLLNDLSETIQSVRVGPGSTAGSTWLLTFSPEHEKSGASNINWLNQNAQYDHPWVSGMVSYQPLCGWHLRLIPGPKACPVSVGALPKQGTGGRNRVKREKTDFWGPQEKHVALQRKRKQHPRDAHLYFPTH